MTHETPPTRIGLGVILSLTASLFFTAASALVWPFQEKFRTLQIVFFQNLFSLIAIAPFALRNGFQALKTKYTKLHLIRDITGVASYFFFFAAIRFLELPEATTLYCTAPFFVPVIWWLWMKEKVEGYLWGTIAVGFIGVAILLNPTSAIFQYGFGMGLLSAIASASALCALRLLNLKREPMFRTLFYYFAVGTVLMFPLALLVWRTPTFIEWIAMISIGLFTAIGQILLTIAYRYGTAAFLSPLGYVSIIYAGLIAWFFFSQKPDLHFLVGTVLVILAGTVTYILKKKPSSLSQTFESPKPGEKPPL